MGKKKNKKKITNGQLFIIIIVVFFIILSVGWFLWRKQKEEEEKLEKENKKKRLADVEKRIIELESHKKEIEETEKEIFIRARLFTGAILAATNIVYCIYIRKDLDLGKILDLNGAILLSYSFIAFITYGTPTIFINNIKQRASNYLRSEHIDSLEELKQLIIEKEKLIAEIKKMDEDNSDRPKE